MRTSRSLSFPLDFFHSATTVSNLYEKTSRSFAHSPSGSTARSCLAFLLGDGDASVDVGSGLRVCWDGQHTSQPKD